MGKQSRAKKERRAARLAGLTEEKRDDGRILDNAAVLPGDMLKSYLITKFIGKSGYKYISIGRYGSLFVNDQSASIVAVNLHRSFPAMSVRGRFNDPNRFDIAVNALHVPIGYPGIVIGRDGSLYIGSTRVEKEEDFDKLAVDMPKVTEEEYDAALKLEPPIIEAQLKQLHEKVKADAQNTMAEMDKKEQEMKQEEEQPVVTETEEIIVPEVVSDGSSSVPTGAPAVQDAEIVNA